MNCGCVRGYRKLGIEQMNGNIFLGGQSASNFGIGADEGDRVSLGSGSHQHTRRKGARVSGR